MYKNLLTKKFFKDNPIMEDSTQRFVYSLLSYDGFEEKATELLTEHIIGTTEKDEEEKRIIENETDFENIIRLLRKNINGTNRPLLIRKALELEETIMPKVAEMFVRSLNDIFIENATRLFMKSDAGYILGLKDSYEQIRSAYAQSLACIVIGFRGEESIIPWMYDKYFDMKKKYPSETFSEGPLLALSELNARFYIDKRP
jgi:hypothetical protein